MAPIGLDLRCFFGMSGGESGKESIRPGLRKRLDFVRIAVPNGKPERHHASAALSVDLERAADGPGALRHVPQPPSPAARSPIDAAAVVANG